MAKLRRYIPVEIVKIIFSWLPVKSLLRFAPICRLWESIISDDEFIKTHLTNSQKRPTLLIPGTIYNKNKGTWFNGACIMYPSYFEVPVSYLRLPNLSDVKISLSSCSNGLLCLTYSPGEKIYLCNPLTMQGKTIPPPDVKLIGSRHQVYTGFYFDSFCYDYKILRIVRGKYGRARVHLYSTESDIWRKIRVNKYVSEFIINSHYRSLPCFVIKGVLYMNGSQKEKPISFQLHDEVFKPVAFRNINCLCANWKGLVSNLFEFKGCVAMLCKIDGLLSLWTLDDSGGDVTWTKNFNLEMNFEIEHWTFEYLGDEQFAASKMWKSGTIIFYDYKKKESKELHSPIEFKIFCKHTESLVSLPGFIQF